MGNLRDYQIVFPKLGIDFDLNSNAFTIFSMTIKWYGIIISLGVILAMVYGFSKMSRFGIDSDKAIDCVLAGLIGGIIGARLYYVIMEWDSFGGDFKEIINIRNGGLAIYGGIIGALLAGALAAKLRKVKLLPLFDITGICFLIGQGIGRWGNFTNHEAFGYNTNLPWGMSSGLIQKQLQVLSVTDSNISVYEPVHPCFLYESFWCILGFIFLSWYSKRRKYDGQIFIMYAGWYGLGRFFIEGLRTDSLMLGTIRVSQALSAVIVVISVILLIVLGQKVKRMGSDYVLYCNTEESKEILLNAGIKRTGNRLMKSVKTEDSAIIPNDSEDSVTDISELDDMETESGEDDVKTYDDKKSEAGED